LCVACGREPVVQTTDIRAERAAEARRRAAAAWEQRGDEGRAREAAEGYALAIENGDEGAYVPAVRAHFFLADCHLRFRREARAEFLRELERSGELAREAVQIEPDGAAVYWLAEARWMWSRAQGPATFLMVEDELHVLAREARAQNVAYDGHGSDRMLGALLARTPGFAGGDIVAAERFFTAARTGSPDDPRNELRMAAEYAVATGDGDLFVELLDEVVALPANTPERICAHRKAEQLRAKIPKFFPRIEPGAH
ncbi:MAG: TRAP transporter TatT component family protein, partial [Myxococcota bacterium]